MAERRTAVEPGQCGCCMTKFGAGAALHVEVFGDRRWWVLDVHPIPRPAPVKRKWRLQV